MGRTLCGPDMPGKHTIPSLPQTGIQLICVNALFANTG
jgi:hypothetical protein